MSSCQDFLMPAAEGGVAVGMEARFATPSFIKLGEATKKNQGGEGRLKPTQNKFWLGLKEHCAKKLIQSTHPHADGKLGEVSRRPEILN